MSHKVNQSARTNSQVYNLVISAVMGCVSSGCLLRQLGIQPGIQLVQLENRPSSELDFEKSVDITIQGMMTYS